MSFSVSTSLAKISTSPVIQRGIDQLGRVKQNDFPSALRIIRQLGTSFLAIDQLTPVSKGRITFLGSRILKILDQSASKESPEEVVARVILDLANLKNALQMEVANFGWIYHPIQIYSQLSQSPKLRELREALPGILHNIELEGQDHFIIDAEPIHRYFTSLDICGMPDQFDLLMLTLLNEYSIEGTKIKIPLSKIPRMDLLERYLETENIHCKLVIQILYACGLQYSLIHNHITCNVLVQKVLFDVLERIDSDSKAKDSADTALADPTVKYNFYKYLEKKPFIPLFSAILEERDLYIAEGRISIDMLVSEDFISRITPMMGDDWLEESAEVYDLIRHIEISCRKIFSKGLLTHLDDLLKAEASDPFLSDRIAFMNSEIVAWHGRTSTSISPDILSVGTKEQFKLFAFYQFMQIYKEKKSVAKPKDDDEELTVRMPSGKKDPRKDKKLARPEPQGGSGSTSIAPTSPSKADAGAGRAPDPVKMGSPTGGSALVSKSTASNIPTEAIHKSRDFLRGISLAPRVNVWNTSAKAGLAYYGYGSTTGHVLPSDEMILRHRFPPQMLSLLFSDLYSKRSTIQRPSGEICRHSESVLHIDGKKYMLEATIDGHGILFHYYARPLTRFADYFQLTRESPSEFPALKGKEGAPTPLVGVSTKEICSDPQGNATFKFDGHNYKMLLLRMP